MEKLEKALIVIRDECNKHERCEGCPLWIDGICGVKKSTPNIWKFKSDNEESRRLFD